MIIERVIDSNNEAGSLVTAIETRDEALAMTRRCIRGQAYQNAIECATVAEKVQRIIVSMVTMYVKDES
jgi:hypothetical protein